MKRLILVAAAVLCLLLAACGGGNPAQGAEKTKAASPAAVASAKTVKGTVLDKESLTITVADGWENMDIPGGVQVYRGSELLEVSVYGINMTDADDEAAMKSFIESYNGTPEEKVQLWGMEFRKTTCVRNGLNQTLMTCIKDGKQVKIQYGVTASENADIAAMINSVKLK